MIVTLCDCDAYPDSHMHALENYLHDDGTWHTFMKWPDGREGNVGDVVRCVDIEAEAGRCIKRA